jgi:hypothetical protein
VSSERDDSVTMDSSSARYMSNDKNNSVMDESITNAGSSTADLRSDRNKSSTTIVRCT